MSPWKYVTLADGTRMHEIGMEPDGALFNPRGYPADDVRAAVARAEAQQHQRHTAAAKKATETRRRRTAALVYDSAQRLTVGRKPTGPRGRGSIYHRNLADQHSVDRGIGYECWQSVLDASAAVRS
jgi:hypothetical protein